MLSFVIEPNVPLPPKGHCHPGGITETLEKMSVGDSFVAPIDKRSAISSMFHRMRPKKFTGRKIDDKSVRVWRLA